MESPATTYAHRRDAFAAEERRLAGISFRYSLVRGALFAAFVACLAVILVRGGLPGWRWWAGAGFWLVAFLWILPYHDRVLQRLRRQGELRRINEEGLLRLVRDWANLPIPTLPEPEDSARPMARDLNLFGRASVAQLLGTVHTPPGKTALASWLLHPAPPEEIVRRQEAVAELAPEIDLRQQLQVRARPMDRRPPDIEPFLLWAEGGDSWLLRRTWLIWLFRALTLLTPVAGLAALSDRFPVSPFLLLATINIALSYQLRERTIGTFDRVGAREKDFQLYAEALATIAGPSYAAGELRRIAGELTYRDRPAHAWMDLLHRRLDLSDVRHSAYLHLPLAAFFLWDFHVLLLLETWQRDAGAQARGWLTALGRFEALAALGSLRFEQPEWCLPRVDTSVDRFAAEALGHPLIADAYRIGNDVEVGPARTFLLVTGSNMSGKSTLLRSIGVNAVLAQAGGPVAARRLRMPPVALATSILVEDSLADGVSFFMAELQRIQKVVAAADRLHGEGRILLYLLDEVLRGTNSYERQVAVRRVVLHLLRHGAIGAVSTHDLQLAEVAELESVGIPVHFRETV
ncbi:MAG TPA: hypothetical protein VIE43_17650, partial [Thermoanaerobaculia bacterium]|nr:hypothetical protein [Thermoanaerobaculia bacterium]